MYRGSLEETKKIMKKVDPLQELKNEQDYKTNFIGFNICCL